MNKYKLTFKDKSERIVEADAYSQQPDAIYFYKGTWDKHLFGRKTWCKWGTAIAYFNWSEIRSIELQEKEIK